MRKFKIFLPILVVLLVVVASFIPPSTSKYYGKTPNYKMTVISVTEWTYKFIGDKQTFEVPASGYYYISAWGGDGGKGGGPHKEQAKQEPGGVSQQISGVYKFDAEDMLYIYVGSAGESKAAKHPDGSGDGGAGGTNGLPGSLGEGGTGGNGYNRASVNSGAGGGGGAGTFVLTEENVVNSTLICSGGGGGSGGGNAGAVGTIGVGGKGGSGGKLLPLTYGYTYGEVGKAGSNGGGEGGSGNSSSPTGSYGGNGKTSSHEILPPGGGGGGGGGGYKWGGDGGQGGSSGVGSASKAGGGGKGGQSYLEEPAYWLDSNSVTHTRPVDTNSSGALNGVVMITFLGAD